MVSICSIGEGDVTCLVLCIHLCFRSHVIVNMISIWRHFIALLALAGSVNCLRCDESRVSGEVQKVIFDCSLRNISRLPVFVPSRATQLHLERNTVVVVPENVFRNLPNLTLLDLSFNKITTLGRMCFVGLRRLRKLNLHGNNLDLVRLPKDTFAGLQSLQVLAIAGQGTIGEYPVAILDGLKQLWTLSVRGEEAPLPENYGRLPKLTTLDLNGGEIRTVSAYSLSAIRNSNIRTLMIRRGSVAHIEAGAFTDFTNLRVLNLNCNSKLNFNKVIETLGETLNSSIDTVILDNTDTGPVGLLDLKKFCSHTHFWNSIRRLSLRDIQLAIVYPRGMSCISGIEEIYVSHNPINSVALTENNLLKEVQKLRKLRFVDVSYIGNADPYMRCLAGCDLNFDVDDYLPSYPKMKSLPLDVDKPVLPLPTLGKCNHEKVVYLPPELRYIDMSHCITNGRDIVGGSCIIGNGTNVLYVNVSGTNFATHLQGFVIGLTRLQVFDVSHGVLQSIGENTIRYFPSLRVLNLSHNALGQGHTPYRKVFSFSYQLETIDLSYNRIRRIHPKTFSTCTKLQQIKLGHNKFDDIDLHISGLTSLNLVDLSENMLPFLSTSFMKELDNLYKTTSFELNLRRNEFICDCNRVTFIRWLQTTEIHVTGRTNLTCFYKGSRQRIMDISVFDLQNACDTYLSLAWAVPLIGIIVLMVLIAAYLFRELIRFKIYVWKSRRTFATMNRSQSLRKYEVTVIFDEYDVELRDWALNELTAKLREWRLKWYVVGRDEWSASTTGWPLEQIVMAIDQSEKLIVCLTDTLRKDPEFQQQLRFAGYSNKRKEDYMFISRGYVSVPEVVSCRGKPWKRETQSFRLDLDEQDADASWDMLREFLAHTKSHETYAMSYRRMLESDDWRIQPLVSWCWLLGRFDIASLVPQPVSSAMLKNSIQGKGPDGKWTRKPLTYRESNIFYLCVTRPPDICINLL